MQSHGRLGWDAKPLQDDQADRRSVPEAAEPQHLGNALLDTVRNQQLQSITAGLESICHLARIGAT